MSYQMNVVSNEQVANEQVSNDW